MYMPDRRRPSMSRSSKTYERPERTEQLKRVSSVKSLDIPVGKVENVQTPRPNTPCRLPRSRVFIKPAARASVDPIAVEAVCGESQVITRSVPRRSVCLERREESSPEQLPKKQSWYSANSPSSARFYFSDEDDVEAGAQVVDNGDPASVLDMLAPSASSAPYTAASLLQPHDEDGVASGSTADMLSSKVRRAVSALRSISFQNAPAEDLDTAWGQASRFTSERNRRGVSLSSRWRRPRGRISSKHGVQEFDAGDDAGRRVSEIVRREDVRPQWGRKVKWSGRNSEQGRAARMMVHGPSQGILAAQPQEGVVLPVNQAQACEGALVESALVDGASAPPPPVDKYVEFIHASAAARGVKSRPKHLSSKVMHVFRRRWK